MEAFMTGKEIDPVKAAGMPARETLRELERISDGPRDAPVLLRHRRVLHPIQVPVIQVMRVDKSADHQGADKVDSEGGALVAAQHQRGVGRARLWRELGVIDQVAP